MKDASNKLAPIRQAKPNDVSSVTRSVLNKAIITDVDGIETETTQLQAAVQEIMDIVLDKGTRAADKISGFDELMKWGYGRPQMMQKEGEKTSLSVGFNMAAFQDAIKEGAKSAMREALDDRA